MAPLAIVALLGTMIRDRRKSLLIVAMTTDFFPATHQQILIRRAVGGVASRTKLARDGTVDLIARKIFGIVTGPANELAVVLEPVRELTLVALIAFFVRNRPVHRIIASGLFDPVELRFVPVLEVDQWGFGNI